MNFDNLWLSTCWTQIDARGVIIQCGNMWADGRYLKCGWFIRPRTILQGSFIHPCRKYVLSAHKCSRLQTAMNHDDVIKWKHFPRYWPFVRGIHRSPVNSPHKGQWRGALIFTLIWARINSWVNNCEAGDLRRNLAHYDVIVMYVLH